MAVTALTRAQGAASAPRRVSILGSTGSVGRSTVDLLLRNREAFTVEALTANRNAALLAEQARQLSARFAAVADPAEYGALKTALSGSGIEAGCGPEALVEAAERPADWVMAGIVGAAGLASTLAAVRCGRIVAFANKEVLVCAGSLFMQEVAANGATLLPVDSEHNAIWQCFDFERVDHIVGAKISIDSATLMNKGLEIIEAHHLFQLPSEQIDVVIHPQSVIHGLVSYHDGSVLAHLGTPDMRTPIAYVLGWPGRTAAPMQRLDLASVGKLTFETPDPERFPALRLAREALIQGGGCPTVLNAANETAVSAFIDGRIGFLDIAATVEETLEAMPVGRLDSLDDVYHIDREARAIAAEHAARRARNHRPADRA